MQYIKGIENYQNENRTAITLGKFDGLHLGHELLIRKVAEHQTQDGVDGVVFAFDMSSFYEKKNIAYERLLTNKQKSERLQNRVAYFVECPFTEEVAHMEAEDFIKKILVDQFHAKYIVVGTDFGFGYQRRGNVKMLEEYADRYDYILEVVEKKQYQGREISSTYIKEELKKGNASVVDELLGYSYENL